MAVEWFYTTNKIQMGPVSWEELRELAEAGILKPHDMVWSEGMDEWIKAIRQRGLFEESDDEAPAPQKSKAATSVAKPPPGRRTRKTDDDEDEDEEEEKKPKKSSRKREEESHKRSVGIKIVLILAGAGILLLGLACGIGALIWIALPNRAAAPVGPRGPQQYEVFNLRPNRADDRRFQLNQGKRIVITVINQLGNPNTDVDLHVFQGNNNRPFAVDVRTPNFDRNCRLEFVVPANDTYKVQLVNLGPGTANSCRVTIVEN